MKASDCMARHCLKAILSVMPQPTQPLPLPLLTGQVEMDITTQGNKVPCVGRNQVSGRRFTLSVFFPTIHPLHRRCRAFPLCMHYLWGLGGAYVYDIHGLAGRRRPFEKILGTP